MKMTKRHCDILAFFYYEKQQGNHFFSTAQIRGELNFETTPEAFHYLHDLRVEGYLDMLHQEQENGKELAVYYMPDKIFKELKTVAGED